MNTFFNHSALEYDVWFVRNEPGYRSELAAIKAYMPKEGLVWKSGWGRAGLPSRWGSKRG
jgi:hypothetical protein